MLVDDADVDGVGADRRTRIGNGRELFIQFGQITGQCQLVRAAAGDRGMAAGLRGQRAMCR
jgi:hypothetical protein